MGEDRTRRHAIPATARRADTHRSWNNSGAPATRRPLWTPLAWISHLRERDPNDEPVHVDLAEPVLLARQIEPSASGTTEGAPADAAPPQLGYPPLGVGRRLSAADRRRVAFKRRRLAWARQRQQEAARRGRAISLARAASVGALALSVLFVVVFVSTAGAVSAYYRSEAPFLAGMRGDVAARDSMAIYDVHGELLYQFDADGAQRSVSLAHIPLTVVNATLAIEDHDYWNNQGIAFTSILRAAAQDLSDGQIGQGGSTITQQLIKNQILGGDVTFARKLHEAILAYGLTAQGTYTKTQIIEMYLNSIPYNATVYGIDDAAHAYFGYDDDAASDYSAAQHLDLAQAAMLAGIPQNPNLNDPLKHPSHAFDRFELVLAAMVKYGYVTPVQADAARAEARAPGFFRPTLPQNKAPHFVELVREQLEGLVGARQLEHATRSGIRVYTTLDLRLQQSVQRHILDHLRGDDVDALTGRPVRDEHVTNAAALLVQQQTGAVRVLLGSADYNDEAIGGNFDVVTQGFRAPASVFKPLVYAAAFAKGWSPATVVADMPASFPDGGAGYRPLDIRAGEFKGPVTLRHALQDSLNIPAVKAMAFAGVDDVRVLAQRMGITTWQGTWGLSSALGSLDVRLDEMTQAYTVFANGGLLVPLHLIDRVTDDTGAAVFLYRAPAPVRVLDERVAYLVTSVLSDNRARADEFGPCNALYLDPDPADCARYGGDSPNTWPAAAKTGTGQNYVDALTIGYTRDYTMAVWAGNNDASPMDQVEGIAGAAPIWQRSMLDAEATLPRAPFPEPAGIVHGHSCSAGVCSDDVYLQGGLLPDNTGDNGPATLPCIALDPAGGWHLAAPPNCQGRLVP